MYLFSDRKGIEAYSNFVARFPGMTGILELFPDRMGINIFYFNMIFPGTMGILYLFHDKKGIEPFFYYEIPWYDGNTRIIPRLKGN